MARLVVKTLAALIWASACTAAAVVQGDCPTVCPLLYGPICASNGVTYDNTCFMRAAACRSGQTLSAVSAGACKKAPVVSRQLKQCPQFCTDIYKPVCASDGQTYGNECDMEITSCQSGVPLKVMSEGECVNGVGSSQPEVAKECNIACTMQYDPVCASDGLTYGNKCAMESAACQTGQPLKVVSNGECPDPAAAVPTSSDKCLGICPLIYVPVCGSDGKTYANDCHMRDEACVTGKPITAVHAGACVEKEPPCQKECFALYVLPVCGSDGKTYRSECQLKADACKNGVALTVVSQGKCPEASDSCKMVPCPKIYDPVCGSDKKQYDNRCLLSNAQCQQLKLGQELKEMSPLFCVLDNIQKAV